MLTADERVKRRWLHLIKLFITQILHNQNRNHQIFLKWVNLLLDQYPTPQGLILQFSKLDHLIREGFLHLLYKGGVRHLNLIYIWLIWMISEYDVWFMLKLIYSRFSLNIDESSLYKWVWWPGRTHRGWWKFWECGRQPKQEQLLEELSTITITKQLYNWDENNSCYKNFDTNLVLYISPSESTW